MRTILPYKQQALVDHSTLLDGLTLICQTLILGLSSQVAFPGPGGVPFTLQPFVVLLLGMLCAPMRVVSIFALFWGLGSVGLPLFSLFGGKVLWGPTGGFLTGFGVAAWGMAWVCEKKPWVRLSRAALVSMGLVGMLVMYSMGWLWLRYAWGVSMPFTALCMTFGLQDAAKVLLAAQSAAFLSRRAF